MSKAKLKKQLKNLDHDGLVEMICELYDARKEAKEYLEFWLDPDPEKELDKCKQKIFKIFFMSEGNPRKSPSVTDVKKVVKGFSSLCFDTERTADLRIRALEIYYMWMNGRRKFMSHQKRVEKLITDTREYMENSGLEDQFTLRLNRIADSIHELFEEGDRPSYRGWRRYLRRN